MKIFISHASEDKDSIARQLAERLKKEGFQVWFDEFSLKIGDSLTKEIDKGLTECDYGIVILSKAFFNKKWPQKELAGLVALETSLESTKKIILPIWHKITADQIKKYSPTLADRIAVSTSEGFEKVIHEINRSIMDVSEDVKLIDETSKSTDDSILIPNFTAWRLGNNVLNTPYENFIDSEKIELDLDIGKLFRESSEKFRWSPNIPEIIKKAIHGESEVLWTYQYFKNRTIYLNGPIDDESMSLVNAQLLYLNSVDSSTPINLYITSPGGGAYCTLGIYDVIQTTKAPINTYGINMVGGSAILILLAGINGNRFCIRDTKLFLGPMTYSDDSGKNQDSELKRISNLYFTLLSMQTGLHSKAIQEDFSTAQKLSPKDAMKYGLIDEIIFSKSILSPWKWGLE